jgi:hypothetical protein
VDNFDPTKPYHLHSAPSAGMSEGNRGGELHRTSHATLEEAKQDIRHLAQGYTFICITYGPTEKVVWPIP